MTMLTKDLDGHELVAVLGAGTSASVGYPLYRELTSEEYITRLDRIQKQTHQAILDDMTESLVPTARALSRSGRHFEEVMEVTYDHNRDLFEALLGYYKTLLLMAEFTCKIEPGFPVGEPFLTFSFVLRNLLSRGMQLTLISFNHDVAIEQSLLWSSVVYHARPECLTGWPSGLPTISKRGASDFYLAANAAIPLEAYADFSAESPVVRAPEVAPTASGQVLLLKLHGSFNMRACQDCGQIYFAYFYICAPDPNWAPVRYRQCEKCGGEVVDSIVPPKRTKSLVALRQIWAAAEEAIQSANELFVVGYSLPAYDVEAVELFKTTSPNCVSTVFNRNRRRETVNHFKSIFSRAIVHSGGFAEFVEHLCRRYGISPG